MKVCASCQCAVPEGQANCPGCGAAVSPGLLGRLWSAFRGGPSGDAGQTGTKTTGATPAAPSVSAGAQAGSFLLVVEDVFTITGRGTVVTGKVASGRVAVGDTVTFPSKKGSRVSCRITGIEKFREIVDEANAGDTVGLILAGKVSAADVGPGTRIEKA